jgi:hypothetical protein
MLGIPLGYNEFVEVFNQYKQPKDKREFSIISVEQSEERILKSRFPVTLKDFFLTAEQCGLSAPIDRMMRSGWAYVTTTPHVYRHNIPFRPGPLFR